MSGCRVSISIVAGISWFALSLFAFCLCWTPPVRRRLSRTRRAFALAAGVAAAVRIVPALLPLPAEALVQWDLESYRLVSAAVLAGRDVYDVTGRYPYLPMHLYALGAAGWVAAHTPLPFELLVRLPGIAADAGLAAMVGVATARQSKDGAAPSYAMAYALNPITLLVTGYHGQFDAVPVALLFAGWLVLVSDARRAPILAGLLVGLAVAEKSWPALVAPIFLLRIERMRDRIAYYAIICFTVAAVLAVYELWVSGGALHAVRTASEYQGYLGAWGYSAVLVRLAGPNHSAIATAEAARLGPLLLATALGLAYLAASQLRRDTDRIALIIAAMYAVTCGWGVHWLAWMAPFALASRRRWGPAYIAVAGSYVSVTYLGFGAWTWGFAWFTDSLAPISWAKDAEMLLWLSLALAAAGTIAAVLGYRAIDHFRRRPPAKRGPRRRRMPPSVTPSERATVHA